MNTYTTPAISNDVDSINAAFVSGLLPDQKNKQKQDQKESNSFEDDILDVFSDMTNYNLY